MARVVEQVFDRGAHTTDEFGNSTLIAGDGLPTGTTLTRIVGVVNPRWYVSTGQGLGARASFVLWVGSVSFDFTQDAQLNASPSRVKWINYWNPNHMGLESTRTDEVIGLWHQMNVDVKGQYTKIGAEGLCIGSVRTQGTENLSNNHMDTVWFLRSFWLLP